MAVKIRSAYSPHYRSQAHPKGASLAKQSMAEECDINNILAQYNKTGAIEHLREGGYYADLPEPLDYHGSMNAVILAREAFSTLDSGLRARFGNDPEKLLEFVHDPANRDEMVTLGLAERPLAPPDTPVDAPVPVVSPEGDPSPTDAESAS